LIGGILEADVLEGDLSVDSWLHLLLRLADIQQCLLFDDREHRPAGSLAVADLPDMSDHRTKVEGAEDHAHHDAEHLSTCIGTITLDCFDVHHSHSATQEERVCVEQVHQEVDQAERQGRDLDLLEEIVLVLGEALPVGVTLDGLVSVGLDQFDGSDRLG